MQMPFGKHKGEELTTIDPEYLRWTLANLDLKADLRGEIEAVLGEPAKRPEPARNGQQPPAAPKPGPPGPAAAPPSPSLQAAVERLAVALEGLTDELKHLRFYPGSGSSKT